MRSLGQIHRLVSELFDEKWTDLHSPEWHCRAELKFPGVYILAFTGAKLGGAPANAADALYVGMSNSAGGVRQRLKQFRNGIEKDDFHSGAQCFFREHCQGRPFSEAATGKQLYFVARTLECMSKKQTAAADDFQQMGHVACLEYYAIAHIVAETGRTPLLNKLRTQDSSTRRSD